MTTAAQAHGLRTAAAVAAVAAAMATDCALREHFKYVTAVVKLYIVLAFIGGAAVALSLLTDIGLCMIYFVIGLPCPACGLTRAFLHLITDGLWVALAFHPLFFLVPFVPLLAHTGLSEKRRNILSFSVLGLFLIAYIARMILLFPHTPPMN